MEVSATSSGQGIGQETVPQEFEPIYLNVKQCAARVGLSHWTIYHWIGEGKLSAAQGLRHAGRSVRIEWRVFKDALDRGELI